MTFHGDPNQFSPISLAFLGDGVFELLVRERLLAQKGNMPAAKLHRLSVGEVKASAQSASYDALSEVLTESELAILKRGRNANSTRAPKSCTVEEYRKATAIETLFGFLYLGGQNERIQELFELMMDHHNSTSTTT